MKRSAPKAELRRAHEAHLQQSPNEALGLGWEHIDLDAGALRVCRTLDCKNHVLIDDTKRPSRRRQVPMSDPELRQLLRERWMAAGRPASGLVFTQEDDATKPLGLDNLRGRHFRPLIVQAAWKACAKCGRAEIEPEAEACPDCESAKLETRAVRIYDLRHGFGTAGLEAGLDAKDVATLMGHSLVRTTQDIYQHVSEERKRESAERITSSCDRSSGPRWGASLAAPKRHPNVPARIS